MSKRTINNVNSFLKVLRNGLTAPFLAFNPPPVRTKIDPQLLEPTYRPLSEDRTSIKSCFKKAMGKAVTELKSETK